MKYGMVYTDNTQACIYPKGVHSFRYLLYANSVLHQSIRLECLIAIIRQNAYIQKLLRFGGHPNKQITKEIEERKYPNECTPFGYVSLEVFDLSDCKFFDGTTMHLSEERYLSPACLPIPFDVQSQLPS